MEIEKQVLSINQVQKLQELRFDVEKYASMYYCPNWIEKFGVNEIQDYLLQIGGLGEDYDGDCIPTMTIGDIINIIPTEINEYVLDMNRECISYDSTKNNLYYSSIYRFIDNLFDCLVWCIKHRYIK
jgi:hypothetical protein